MATGQHQPRGRAADVVNAVKDLKDSDSEYEICLTRLVAEADAGFGAEIKSALETTTDDSDEAYALFYALNIHCRRMKQHSELFELVRDSGDRFRTRATYPHLQSLSYATARRDEEAFHCASDARERAPGHAGILHHYASVALDRAGRMDTPDPALLDEAQKALDAALAATHGNYARYHATYARLHTLREEYAAAEESLDRAIDLEDQGVDWPVRIGEYEAIRLSNRVAKSSMAISEQQQQTVRQIEEMRESLENRVGAVRSEAFQLLGLLGAVIAFVVSTSTIAAQLESFETGGRLIVLLSGAILVVYAGFGAAFGRLTWRYLIVHVAVLALGFAVGAYAVFWWNPT